MIRNLAATFIFQQSSTLNLMEKKIRILIVSPTPWDDNNSFGNSFSNIFGGNSNYEIANIYLQEGLPNTEVCQRFFQISEKTLIRRLFRPSIPIGIETYNAPGVKNLDSPMMKRAKILRWQILFWARDAIWATGKWHSSSLDDFIRDFNPDIIFQPIFYEYYVNRIGLYAQQLTGAPMIGYISDDNYTLKQFSLSPLYWVDRLIKRRYVKRTIDRCQLLYVITEQQRKEYNNIFGDKCKVLFKGGDFGKLPPYSSNEPVRYVYTGNLGSGRWKTLAALAKSIERQNKDGQKAILEIYSATSLSQKALKSLSIEGSSYFKGRVDVSQVPAIQAAADVLVHVEPFSLTERYTARLSFSTKIVDYMAAGRAILGIGWEQSGAIVYLRENGAAAIVTDPKKMDDVVGRLTTEHDYRQRLTEESFRLGRRNHQIDEIRTRLYNDLVKYVDAK